MRKHIKVNVTLTMQLLFNAFLRWWGNKANVILTVMWNNAFSPLTRLRKKRDGSANEWWHDMMRWHIYTLVSLSFFSPMRLDRTPRHVEYMINHTLYTFFWHFGQKHVIGLDWSIRHAIHPCLYDGVIYYYCSLSSLVAILASCMFGICLLTGWWPWLVKGYQYGWGKMLRVSTSWIPA